MCVCVSQTPHTHTVPGAPTNHPLRNRQWHHSTPQPRRQAGCLCRTRAPTRKVNKAWRQRFVVNLTTSARPHKSCTVLLALALPSTPIRKKNELYGAIQEFDVPVVTDRGAWSYLGFRDPAPLSPLQRCSAGGCQSNQVASHAMPRRARRLHPESRCQL